MTQLLDDLKAVRELLSSPKKWTQGQYAKDARGHAVDDCSPKATCWCLVGSMWKRGYDVGQWGCERVMSMINPLTAQLPPKDRIPGFSLTVWNDDPARTHEEVLALLDKAILAESSNA